MVAKGPRRPARHWVGEVMKEHDLCREFIDALPKEWTAYPETCGWDILLVRRSDGFQVGVEAKLNLNAKVICQAAESISHHQVDAPGPDCRAVLVPAGKNRTDFAGLLNLLGLVVIRPCSFGGCSPRLPDDGYWNSRSWPEFAPARRHQLPDYIPDVVAGSSAPVSLTEWKISAIKIVILLEKRGYVTRADFAKFKISMSRWTQMRWLVSPERGKWVAGSLPDFRAQHPVNFNQIYVDFDTWSQDVKEADQ